MKGKCDYSSEIVHRAAHRAREERQRSIAQGQLADLQERGEHRRLSPGSAQREPGRARPVLSAVPAGALGRLRREESRSEVRQGCQKEVNFRCTRYRQNIVLLQLCSVGTSVKITGSGNNHHYFSDHRAVAAWLD